jgi:hypothetical protein
MDAPDAALRQDLIQNAVNHQVEKLEEVAQSPARLATLFSSELNHDFLTWPRQYLEAYLDSDSSGRIPLSAEQLQDVLEAAFERDEDLAIEFLQQLNAGKSSQILPGYALHVAFEPASDAGHRYVLLVQPVDHEDLKRLSAQLTALPHSPERITAAGERELMRAAGMDREEVETRLCRRSEAPARDYVAAGRAVPELLQLVLPQTHLDPALTDSGVYRGTIIATRGDDVVQQITPQSAVIHHKDLLNTVPFVGQHVRIRYSDGVARVEAVRERSRGRELSR